MNYLLDTHTFIWWDSNAAELSSTAFKLLRDKNNSFWLSIASLWEMQIKLQTGKLKLRMPLRELVEHQQRTNHIQLLTMQMSHVLALDSLPLHHRDPFDRILIAQAQIESLTLISHDPIISEYPVSVIW